MYSKVNNLYEPYQGFIRGNMFKDLFDQYGKVYDIKPMNEQAELLTYLDMFEFACIDLALYLDIYPNDLEMLNIYNQINNEKVNVLSKYEESFGAITQNSKYLNNSWSWDNSPWPWEV